MKAFALLLAWLTLTAQRPAPPAQPPPQAVNQLARDPVATVAPTPNPALVDSPVTLQIVITVPVGGTLDYEYYLNGSRLTQCPDSPMCEWTASVPGDYTFHAIVRRQALGRGGRGLPELTIEGPRSILKVQPLPAVTPDPTLPEPETPLENVAPLPDVAVPPSAPVPPPDLTETPAPPAPPIALQLRAIPDSIKTGELITFQVSTTDGRPIPAYSFDPGDGSRPSTLTSGTFDASYSRAGRYTAAVSPTSGQTGLSATAVIVVSPAIPWIWVSIVVGIVGVATIVWVLKRPDPSSVPLPPPAVHTPPIVPTATFHPHPDDAVRFEPSTGNGIALEVHYVPNDASVSYAPRVQISKERP